MALEIITLLAALCIGSFLNVVISRGPALWGLVETSEKPLGLAMPRSQCPSCQTPIKPHHLIPIVSYIFLGGKCANCKSSISLRYPIIEILVGLTALLTIVIWGLTLPALVAFIFIITLITLGCIDADTGYLPDMLTLPLIGLGFIANANNLFTPLQETIVGAVAGFVSFWVISTSYKKLRGYDGLGLGDAKLLAAIGAWMGWFVLPLVVLVSALSGLLWIGLISLKGVQITSTTALSFGPFIAFSAIIIFLAQHYGLLSFYI